MPFTADGAPEAGWFEVYHGWNWDGEGRNVWVPTQRRPMAVFDLCSYPVRETDGRVLVRLDPDG